MNLKSVEIKNFRSVKEATLVLEPACRTLVGINEAGKTNILKALSLVDRDVEIDPDDVRFPSPDEDAELKGSVEFTFNLEKSDHDTINDMIVEDILMMDFEDSIIQRGSVELDIYQIITEVTSAIFYVDLNNAKKWGRYFTFPTADKLLSKWFKPSALVPADFKIPDGVYEGLVLKNYPLIAEDIAKELPPEYLKPIQVSDFHVALGSKICSHVTKSRPRAVFWSHTEDNLIPSNLDIAKFNADPTICKPLRNAFRLAGIENVSSEFQKAEKRANGVRNLLDRVGKIATQHVSKIWPDYSNIEIDLRQNGDYLETSIKDKYNLFDFKRRSDGFKRFLSFLLTLSIPSETNELSGVLILIDDPDMGLHPSGTRYVRDELIKISKKNVVVLSTHSIFMIDKENIGRHIIVKKADEVTKISNVNESNILDEEVIYNALGFSFLEILKAENIIFEGWRDKVLFNVVSAGVLPREQKPFKEYGQCHLKGVKEVKGFVPLVQMARRKCLIVTDGDAPALERKREHERARMYGVWKTYADLIPSEEIVTVEDFVKQSYFVSSVRVNQHPALSGINLTHFSLNGESNKLKQFSDWLNTKGVSKIARSEIENQVKAEIFDDLKKRDVRGCAGDAIASMVSFMRSIV